MVFVFHMHIESGKLEAYRQTMNRMNVLQHHFADNIASELGLLRAWLFRTSGEVSLDPA